MRLMIAAVAALLVAPSSALPIGGAPEGKQDKEEGFASIFNGKDLTGWVYGKSGKG